MGLSPSSSFLVPASTPDTTNNQVIGALAAKQASQWRQQTISQALDEVLFPTIPAVYVQPTLSISTGGSLIFERGSSSGITFSATFTQNNAGPASSIAWKRDETTFAGQTLSPGDSLPSYNISNLSSFSSVVEVTCTIGYSQGPQLQNNKGQNSGTPIPEGSLTSTGLSLRPIYPYYYLKSPVTFTRQQFVNAILAGNANAIHASAVLTKVVSPANGTLTIPYNLNAQFFGVAHANGTGGYNNKLSFYTSESDRGPIAAAFTVGDQTTAGATWSGQSFRYYITPGAITNSNPNIQLRETTT